MDIPQPPQDEEYRTIIDRLAVFVARNGQEFETMTKIKQKDNPRFQFLFGGEYYNYYNYKVSTEQAIIKHQANQANIRQQMGGGPPGGQNFGMGMGQDFHGTQQQLPPPRQTQFGQQQRPPGGMPSGPRGPMPPRMMQQQQQNFQSRFSSHSQMPQRQPFHGQGQGNMNMPPRNYQAQEQYGEYDEPGMGSGPGPRGPGPRAFQSRFQPIPQHQPQRSMMQQGPAPGIMGNPNLQAQNFHPAAQAQFGQPQQPQQSQFGPPQQLQSQPQFGLQPASLDQDLRGFGSAPNAQQVQAQLLQVNRLNAPQQQPRLPEPQPPAPTPVVQINIEALQTQKKALEDRVRESEQNLAAQQAVLLAQQKSRIEEALSQKHANEISTLAAELNVDITEFDRILQPIMDSCTKESIANGKAWIFTHTSTKRHYQLLTLYLLQKTTNASMAFMQRLHVIYLVNDVLHHCMRKGAEDLQLALEAAVVPMFCFAKVVEAGNEENVSKLDKLFGLWESKSNYVSKEAVIKLRNYDQTWSEYKNDLVARNAALVTQVAGEIQKTFEGYQAQHQMFAQHVSHNIKQVDEQIQRGLLQQVQIQQQQQQQAAVAAAMRNISEQALMQQQQQQAHAEAVIGTQPAFGEQQNLGPTTDQGGPPIPDLSRPPPGFPPPNEKDLIPTLPYYELPAGLMVPLVKPEDDNYKPLDPNAIRLPPPCPPSEKLLLAVEAFYGPPSHDNPRDSEGWERLGLYEYYKAKNLARKQKEDEVREGRRQKSRSPTPIRRDSSPSGRSPPRRRYQSKSPSPSRRRRSRSRSASPSRSRRRSRRSRSRSPEAVSRRRSFRRSPTPPSFSTAGLGAVERKLDESNKGHQLLKKMGWGGSGLGANEQGIEAPISGGDVRDKQDQYKGVGISLNDPFESYRKNKAASFVERMRSRDEK